MFENFIKDMGFKLNPTLTIERLDNNGTYSPTNCKWGTKKEQSNNKRDNRILEYNGQKKNMAQWEGVVGISQRIIRQRLEKGWTIEQALTTPLDDFRIVELDGMRRTCREWEAVTGIDKKIIRQRLINGWSIRDALTKPMRKQRSDSKHGRFLP